jgi:hypothetical protein
VRRQGEWSIPSDISGIAGGVPTQRKPFFDLWRVTHREKGEGGRGRGGVPKEVDHLISTEDTEPEQWV